MKRAFGVLTVVALLFPISLRGQERSPELQRLEFLVGDWAYENSDGNQIGSDVCRWLGTGFLQCEGTFTNASGTTVQLLSVFGYDTAMERYTWVRYWSTGLIDDHIGWLNDDIWRWVQRDSAGGRYRLTENIESPTSISFQWERSIEGGDWEPTLAGRANKVR